MFFLLIGMLLLIQNIYLCIYKICVIMKKTKFIIICLIFPTLTYAQADSTFFKGIIENEEYQVWIDMDFYTNNVQVEGQEDVFGNVPGFFGAKRDNRKWIITDAEVNGTKAKISIINDYGSEDLTATLTYEKDGSYVLKQEQGSTIKIAVNRKWVKIPSKLVFRKKEKGSN